MIVDHKFGSNCDQGFRDGSAPRRCASGASAQALVLVGLVIMGTTAIAARAAIVSIAPATRHLCRCRHAGQSSRSVDRRRSRDDAHKRTARGSFWSRARLRICATGKHRAKSSPGPARRGWARALRLDGAGSKTRLGARERVPFRARLAAPPAGVRDVLVKFAAPGDKGSFTESPS